MTVKRILDRDFRYRPSYDTNVRETFERARREQAEEDKKSAAREVAVRVVRLERQVR